MSRTTDIEQLASREYKYGFTSDVKVSHAGAVEIQMTLTAPACPSAQTLPDEVESRVMTVEGVTGVRVEVVWEPAWTPDRMSEAAKLQLGLWQLRQRPTSLGHRPPTGLVGSILASHSSLLAPRLTSPSGPRSSRTCRTS